MKTKFKVALTICVTLAVLSSSLFIATLNAASSTHEAEASSNNLKYASVSGGNVVFDNKKDAYVEMKKVNSPSSGNATLTFYYSASNSFPLELKVNGSTICSKDTISSSSKTVSYSANMNSGSDNKIKFKIREAVSGVKLDKVVISTDGSSSGSTSSTSTPSDSSSTSSSSSSGGSAKWSQDGDGTITVTSGVFDGGGKSYGSNVGDGSQSESQPAVFELEKGTSLKNCKIVPPAGDGIHVDGNNTVSNVTFTDVGEDAISMRSGASGGKVTVEDCSFSKADDKVLQVNKESTWYLYDNTVNGAGKVMRQNGGKTFKLTVYIDGLKATGVKEAIVRSDSSNCTVYYKNISCNLSQSDWWMGKLTAKSW
ncbi:MAG: pectate lyase [Clostridiales bacterium]